MHDKVQKLSNSTKIQILTKIFLSSCFFHSFAHCIPLMSFSPLPLLMLSNTCICFNLIIIKTQCYCSSYPETVPLNQCLLSGPDRRCCFRFNSWEDKNCFRIAADLPMPLYNSQSLRGIITSNTQLVKSWLHWKRQWDLCHLHATKPRFQSLYTVAAHWCLGFSSSLIKSYFLHLI